jgi:GNAT superfamily N-acetyltransferase
VTSHEAEATPSPTIRAAELRDAPGVAELLIELGYPGDSIEQVRERLARWVRAENAAVLVAEYQERLAGVVAVAAIPYFEHDGNWGRIVALVVAERSRGRGIGRLLVESAEQAALRLGCTSMELTSARRRPEAHAFYPAIGYQDWSPNSARYVKDLVPGASAKSYAMRGDPP